MALEWNLDTANQLLHLLTNWKAKVNADLGSTPPATYNTSLKNWCKLLGILYSITPSVVG